MFNIYQSTWQRVLENIKSFYEKREHLYSFCILVVPILSQPAIACLKLIIKPLEQGVKYVQS